ncbi:MAG: hypothetical protein RLZZ210_819 [Pseudomonadota bacterium]|jgi:inner membrane protein
MIIGHIPAGYIFAKLSYMHFYKHIQNYKYFTFFSIFGSIAPDLDMFYFHLVDHGKIHHHKYFSHYPIFWLALMLISSIFLFNKNLRRKIGINAFTFSLCGFIHILLDSIVGDIWWLAPFVDKPFAIAQVPALYKPWWLNFIFHWSFGIELLLALIAVILYKYSNKK